jgi:hypothetical protein
MRNLALDSETSEDFLTHAAHLLRDLVEGILSRGYVCAANVIQQICDLVVQGGISGVWIRIVAYGTRNSGGSWTSNDYRKNCSYCYRRGNFFQKLPSLHNITPKAFGPAPQSPDAAA